MLLVLEQKGREREEEGGGRGDRDKEKRWGVQCTYFLQLRVVASKSLKQLSQDCN